MAVTPILIVIRSDWPSIFTVMDSTARRTLSAILLAPAMSVSGSNAAKFTENGEVTLTVSADEDSVYFSVRDTGIGISDEQMKNLFQDFNQADKSIAREYGGTGLGLSITQRFAQLMNGVVKVESEPGKGSTFTLVLPR